MKTRVNELLQRTGKRQKAAFGICLALVAAGLMWFLDEDTSARSSVHNGDTEVTRIVADLTRGGRAERSWLDISENRFDDLEKQIRKLESQRQELKRDNEKIIEQNTALAADANQAIDAQAEEIRRLRLQVTAVTQDRQGTEKITSQEETGVGRTTGRILPTSINENPFRTARGNIASRSGSHNNALAAPDDGKALPVKAAALVHFELGESRNVDKSLDLYIPAGAYAPAEVISGVDAAVGVSSQADPRPVLFRVTGPAVSAALGGTRQTTDIEGCTITGAAFGDLSSEKVYVRLQTMTCSRRPGHVFETDVEGYMAGSGKAGVRGIVVSREGDLVAQSFLAGAAGGIGGAVGESMQPPIIETGTTVTTGQKQISDILTGSLGKGIDRAGDKVADYLVKRAEQYQPVIVMQAGTRVELVFIAGVSLEPDDTIKTIKLVESNE